MLREKQMAERRRRILDAAEALIRQAGGTGFPMLALSERAEVSPTTPYNLFGSKAGVLYALLNRTMDQIDERMQSFSTSNPIERALEAAESAADFFARDPEFFRSLYLFLLGVRDSVHRPHFMNRGLEFWRRPLETATTNAILPGGAINAEELARELMIHFVGVMELWLHEELDSEGFRAQTVYGTSLLLLGLAGDAMRPGLLKRLKDARRKLPREFSFSIGVNGVPKLKEGSAA
jgi:AcrR family transcriptional regulator